MRTPFAALMQSKYFTPTFNSAIFDGPIRIYFSQVHEAFALKVYFSLQKKLLSVLPHCKEVSRKSGQTIMIMVYPTADNFQYSFEGAFPKAWLAMEEFGGDAVLGINGPREEDELHYICDAVESQLSTWKLPSDEWAEAVL